MVNHQPKIFILFFSVLSAMLGLSYCIATSRTFFTPRSIQSDISIFNATSTIFNNSTESANRFSVSATAFYQESTNARDLARYFMPGGKDELVVKGANAPGDRDISATWLQIAGNNDGGGTHYPNSGDERDEELFLNKFESKIKIRPEFKRFGAVIRMFKSLGCQQKFWFDMTLPFAQVQTDVDLQEYDVKNNALTRQEITKFKIFDAAVDTRIERAGEVTPLNATEAFSNPSWKYGKIKSGCQKLAGLADITMRFGCESFKNDDFVWNIYLSGVIPTGYKPKNEFLFEPIIGNNQHGAIGFGTNFDLSAYQTERASINFYTSFDYTYLFKNHQMRSFDLKNNGEWSRYLLTFFPKQRDAVIGEDTIYSGINVFTERMNIIPGSEIHWTNDISVVLNDWNIHFGYNLWWRDREKPSLKKAWDKEVALLHFFTREDLAFRYETFSKAAIKNHFIGDTSLTLRVGDGAQIILVTQDDLNIDSAAHPDVIGHKFYASAGHNMTWAGLLGDVTVGASYQANESYKSVQDWGVWLQLSISA